MINEYKKFPWFFFFKFLEIFALSLVPIVIYFFIFGFETLSTFLPYLFLNILLFCGLTFSLMRPLGKIFFRLAKFRDELPFEKKLKLFYKKNEWAELEEAIKNLDLIITKQSILSQNNEEKTLTILESISEGIIAFDQYQTFLFSNSKFKHYFPMSQSINLGAHKMWHIFSSEKVLTLFENALKSNTVQVFREFHHGTYIFDLKISPLKDHQGKVIGTLGVFYDVTEHVKTLKMKTDFIANVSHEIRTPLTSLQGYSQILDGKKNNFDEESHFAIQKIIKNTKKMSDLFNDLLELSVLESIPEIQKEIIDVEAHIKACYFNHKNLHPDKKIEYSFEGNSSSLWVNAKLFDQVLNNLFSNSIKYSDKEIISMKFSIKAEEHAKFFSIWDNGPGISLIHQERIFERFYRGTHLNVPGTGLGLAIVKNILLKHSGEIKILDTTQGLGLELKFPEP